MDLAAQSQLLPPTAATLVELASAARSGLPTPWAVLAVDPGALAACLTLNDEPHELAAMPILEHLLARGFPTADWSTPAARTPYLQARAAAAAARVLAPALELPPERCELFGWFVHLGRLVQALQPTESLLTGSPATLTRKLARRWEWPTWLVAALLEPTSDTGSSQESMPGWARLARWLELLAQEEQGQRGLLRGLAPALLDQARAASRATWTQPLPLGMALEAAELLHRSLHLPASPPDTRRLERLETENEHLHQRLAAVESRMAQTVRDRMLTAVAELAAGAAHEINNPLAVIALAAKDLLKSEESLERAKSLERIGTQTTRIHRLLRDLLLFARPPRPQLRRLALETMVRAAVERARAAATGREVSLSLEGKLPRIKGRFDAKLVDQALDSLILNAIDAAPAGGWVRVGLAALGPTRAEVTISDNGPGVPLEDRDAIFAPFYSHRPAGRGAGLGLPKAWRVARLHLGDLSLVGPPGTPTTFRLVLGLDGADELAPRNDEPAPERIRVAARSSS